MPIALADMVSPLDALLYSYLIWIITYILLSILYSIIILLASDLSTHSRPFNLADHWEILLTLSRTPTPRHGC